MTDDTTDPSYWLNWRFLVCCIWILSSMAAAAILIWRYEGFDLIKIQKKDVQEETVGIVYKDEAWKTTSERVHPTWLLAYRVIAFSILLALLISDVIVKSSVVFYFYTEWTFTLVTLYFGLASIFSIHGCLYLRSEVHGTEALAADAECTYIAPMLGEYSNISNTPRNLSSDVEPHVRETADVWGYAFQIIFQTCAGAVILTDLVYWSILYPFRTNKDHKVGVLGICLHSVNAVLLLGDVMFNSLRFPLFRVSYFALWTCIFVIFQWILHACVSLRWPYPFLDLSSPFAPIWYVAVGLLTLPCYTVFLVVFKLKKRCWGRVLPEYSW